ncbi:MAG: hypothetical protein QW666_03865 [Candidatus Woesearchaeota archaeon]
MNKKAALEISINAIVVLILAITILGLGLGFIKSQFGTVSEQFTQVSSEIKSSLIEKIKESGELLVFNRAEIEAKVGKPEAFYVGVKNTASGEKGSVCFRLAIKCLRPLNPDNTCTATVDRNAAVGGKDDMGNTPVENWVKMFEEVDIKNADVGVFPITLQIAKALPDTYLMEFNVYKSSLNGDCENAGDFEIYQSKQFFIKLT